MKGRNIIINTLCVFTAIACIALTFWGNIKNGGVLTPDGFIGVLATLIGVCATIIVGFQIASFFKIQENEKQLEQLKVERDETRKDLEQVRTYLSNISVLVSGTSKDKVIRSLADITSIVCDIPKSDNALVILNRYKSLFGNIKNASYAERKALSGQLPKLKNINIPKDIDHYTEIIGLHAEILKNLEEAAKEQNG